MSRYHPVTLKKMLLVFVFCLLWSYVSQYFIYCFVFPVWKEEKEKMSLYRHKCRAFLRPSNALPAHHCDQ